MAVYLSFQEVRERFQGSRAQAGSASLLLERFFHQLLAGLMGEDPRLHWTSALAEADRDREHWRGALLDHVYRRIVAPFLRVNQSELQADTEPVCRFWKAVEGLCNWIVHCLWGHYESTSRFPGSGAWERRALPPEIEIRDPDWTQAVRLTGVRGDTWRVPGYPGWCVINMTLEPGENQDELGEMCLYHVILEGVEAGHRPNGQPAVISFTPGREERLFEAKRIEAGQRQLKRMIGQWAGVVTPSHGNALVHKSALAAEYVQMGQVLLELLEEHGMAGRFSGAPVVELPMIQFAVTLAPHVRVARLAELAERIKQRLKLKSLPLVDHLGGQLMIHIERAQRPIVFFWPMR